MKKIASGWLIHQNGIINKSHIAHAAGFVRSGYPWSDEEECCSIGLGLIGGGSQTVMATLDDFSIMEKALAALKEWLLSDSDGNLDLTLDKLRKAENGK